MGGESDDHLFTNIHQSIRSNAMGVGFLDTGNFMAMPASSAVFFILTPTACSEILAMVG
jgi:hypothetical protein